MSEKVANIITVIIVAIVYVIQGLAYLVPWRGIGRLRLSLALIAFTWSILFVVSFFEIIGFLHPPLSPLYNWTIRISLIVFGLTSTVELIRAGAFRRGYHLEEGSK